MKSTTLVKSVLAVGVLVGAVGCSKKGAGADDHFGDWKADEVKAKLQGAWVGPSTHNLVSQAAYEITGDDVKMFANGKDETYKLKIDNPCQLGLLGADGTTSYIGYVVRDGKLIWGGGDTGTRKGTNAVMCAGISLYALDGDKCSEKSMSGRWEEAKCGFRKDGGNEVFAWTWMKDEKKSRPMDGDFLLPDKDETATKAADFAAAKAALKP